MVDRSGAVADTHALLFHAAGSARLGQRAKAYFHAAEQRDALIHVPVAVIWEVSLLVRGGRVSLRRPTREFFADLFSNPAFQPYDLTPDQVFDAGDLSFTRDPFDALICASARQLGLPLLTRDEAIRTSGAVRTVW